MKDFWMLKEEDEEENDKDHIIETILEDCILQ